MNFDKKNIDTINNNRKKTKNNKKNNNITMENNISEISILISDDKKYRSTKKKILSNIFIKISNNIFSISITEYYDKFHQYFINI